MRMLLILQRISAMSIIAQTRVFLAAVTKFGQWA